MTSPESTPEQHYASVYELLTHVAAEAAELEKDARSKLYEEKNNAGYMLGLRKRAYLIAELPTMLENFRLYGGIVPDEAESFAESYAAIANLALRRNGAFMLSTILDLNPGLDSDPNDLERLAASLEPSKED